MSASTILQIALKYSLCTECIIFSIGFIGNLLNILIFTQLKCFRNNRCTFYLTIELIYNFINQIISMILTILTSLYGANFVVNSIFWCRLRYIMSQSCALISFSMICLAAADQFFSTNYQVYLRQICTLKLARYFVFISICIWFFHSLLFVFSVNMVPLVGCSITNEIWIQYSTFFFYPVLVGLLPIVISSLFSLLAYRKVRRIVRRQIPIERRRFDQQITAMVLIRVVFFVFLTFPYNIYRMYAINNSIDQRDVLRYAINRLIQVILFSFVSLNYAISFYLFLITSSRYRRQVKYFLTKKCWKKCKICSRIEENQIHPEHGEATQSNIELE